MHGVFDPCRLLFPQKLQPQTDIVEHRAPGQHRIFLKDHAHIAVWPLKGTIIVDRLPLVGSLQAGNDAQQG
jgi:hypothetical protein